MRYVLFLVAFCIGTAGAFADDRPNQWRLIAGDGSVATSDCIGTYETVDCLADSIAACDAWTEFFTSDGSVQSPSICDEIPGYVDGRPFYARGPKDALVHLYRTNQWILQRAEDWGLYKDDHLNAQPGDTVLDFDSISCSPNPQCLERIDTLAPASEILAHCPRTYCEDTLRVQEDKDADGRTFLYDEPYVTFLVRQQDAQWRIVAWHFPNYYGLGGGTWIPDHWKR